MKKMIWIAFFVLFAGCGNPVAEELPLTTSQDVEQEVTEMPVQPDEVTEGDDETKEENSPDSESIQEEESQTFAEPQSHEESRDALDAANNVIIGMMAVEDEVNRLADVAYTSNRADFLPSQDVSLFIQSTREQALLALDRFNDDSSKAELSIVLDKLDQLDAKLSRYEQKIAAYDGSMEQYDDLLMLIDSFHDELVYDFETVEQFLSVYGY